MGAYSAPVGPDLTPERCLERADEALYRAKAGGRNRVVLWGADSGADFAGRGER